MQQFTLEVNKKVDGKYEPVGSVAIHYPLLSELGFDVQPNQVETGEDGKPVNQGLPIYADERHQYAFDSVFSAVKADARNKLVGGTADLKDGASIAETLEELLTVTARSGEALKAIRNCINSFKTWLPSTGKSSNVQAAILALAASHKGLALQSADKKQRFLGYLSKFAETLTPEQATEYSRHLQKLEEACNSVDALDDM